MSDIALEFNHVWKKFKKGEKYNSLRDLIPAMTKRLFTGNHHGELQEKEFWALKEVSFQVERGEAYGIIGPNGAGKSTIFRLLSGILRPSKGEIKVNGRLSALIEIGAGFHPDLTGRENIYLNGAILGMKKDEINKKFDEIVEFSGIPEFIDTPVKRYSSGMYARLGFSVAAHLDPEILLVDEVLAVGDAQFQKKCLGKMGEVRKEGRTILFVSHNIGAVTSLCSKGMLLNAGKVQLSGEISDVAMNYLESGKEIECQRIWDKPMDSPGDDTIRLKAVRVVSEGMVSNNVSIDKDIFVEIEYWNLKAGAFISTSIHLIGKTGVEVLASANFRSACLNEDEWFGKPHPAGIFKTRCKIPAHFLNEGRYFINAIVLTDITKIHVKVDGVVSFNAHDTGEMRKEFTGHWLGVVRPKLEWHTELQIGEEFYL